MRRFQFSLRREPGQVIQTFARDLRRDVDPLDITLREFFDRRCSFHRGHRSTFTHRLAQSSQPSSVAGRVDDRGHAIGVLCFERFDDVAGGERINSAGEVATGNERKTVFHSTFEIALQYDVVERVDGSRGHANTHLIFSGLGIWQIVNRTTLTEVVESESAHPLLLGLVNRGSLHSSNGMAPTTISYGTARCWTRCPQSSCRRVCPPGDTKRRAPARSCSNRDQCISTDFVPLWVIATCVLGFLSMNRFAIDTSPASLNFER